MAEGFTKGLVAVFPGTFDPLTNGHMDIIERVSKKVGLLIVLIVANSAKYTMFTEEERKEHIESLVKDYENVTVDVWGGLTVEYAKMKNAVMIRGLRNGTDFDYELQIAEANKKIADEVETLFIATAPEFSYLSSTVVKEMFKYGGNISMMVPEYVYEKMAEKRKGSGL